MDWLPKARELRGSARDFLRQAPPEVRACREVVLCLVAKDGLALEWAATALRADRELVLAAVSKGAFALEPWRQPWSHDSHRGVCGASPEAEPRLHLGSRAAQWLCALE